MKRIQIYLNDEEYNYLVKNQLSNNFYSLGEYINYKLLDSMYDNANIIYNSMIEYINTQDDFEFTISDIIDIVAPGTSKNIKTKLGKVFSKQDLSKINVIKLDHLSKTNAAIYKKCKP